MHDYAIWQREHPHDGKAWDSTQEVLTFCRHGGCWVIFWDDKSGVMTPYLVKLPDGG
jgi:hypothetical protein